MPLFIDLCKRYFRTFFIILCLVGVFAYSKAQSFALFHTLVELFSIVVAFASFIIAWNSRKMQGNKYLQTVGLSFLFIGALDLLHTLTFKGFELIPAEGFPANQFWIATRIFQSMVLLTGFVFIKRKRPLNSDLLVLVYLTISLLIFFSIVIWKNFPVCFIQGVGQTDFKIYAEYAVIGILIASLGVLYRYQLNFDKRTSGLLAASMCFAIASAYCFSLYTSNVGLLNEIGHYGKLITYFLIYKACVEAAFVKPMNLIFRELKASESGYKTLAENLPGIIMRFDAELNCLYSNQQTQTQSGKGTIAGQLTAGIKEFLKTALANHQGSSGDVVIEMPGERLIYAYQLIPEISGKVQTSTMLLIGRDVTASRKEQQYLSGLLDTIPHQVWTAAPGGQTRYVNHVVCENFSADSTTLLKEGWRQYIHPQDYAQSESRWQESLRSAAPYTCQFRLRLADGNYYWHLSQAHAVFEGGNPMMWIGTNTNIDSQKKGQEQRDEFISIASHELKTPLTSIKAFNQLLLRTTEMSKIHLYLEKVDLSTQKLERLINDMLEVSRINAGKLQMDPSRFDFQLLLEECCHTLQLSSESHRIELQATGPLLVEADRFRIEQVINNLLSNAIKYSPQADKVIVSCKSEPNGVVVCVQDFGIGIEQAELEKLFERYYRSDNAAQRFGGLGLGLFISAEIIKSHQGTFWIESESGSGSSVYFRIPNNTSKVVAGVVDNSNEYEDEYLSIRCNMEKGQLEVNWSGHQSVSSVQNGGMQMIAILKSSGFSKVINDNRQVLGNWSEASDWTAKVWFPMMVDAGLKDFAWVFSPSIFAKLAAQKSYDESTITANVSFFSDYEQAQQWLDELQN